MVKNIDMKLWKDLKNDDERAEFIESGRAYETGIIAKALEKELADLYRFAAAHKRSTEVNETCLIEILNMNQKKEIKQLVELSALIIKDDRDSE